MRRRRRRRRRGKRRRGIRARTTRRTRTRTRTRRARRRRTTTRELAKYTLNHLIILSLSLSQHTRTFTPIPACQVSNNTSDSTGRVRDVILLVVPRCVLIDELEGRVECFLMARGDDYVRT
jgi:hypothetical protein